MRPNEAMVIVDTCWGPREAIDRPFWHLVVASGGLFYNNVRAGRGALLSVSAGIQAEPHLENAHTPYSLTRMHDEKERVFEDVRRTSYPACPSRLKTLYVFDNRGFADRALAEWYSSEPKVAYECRVLAHSVLHRTDAAWLNYSRDQWPACAHRYWRGEMSQNPFAEVLVHGALYFPDWQEFPEQ